MQQFINPRMENEMPGKQMLVNKQQHVSRAEQIFS